MRPIALRKLLAGASLLLVALLITRGRINTVAGLSDQGFFNKYPFAAEQLRSGTLPPERLTELSPGYLTVVAASQRRGLSVGRLRNLQIVATTVAAAACATAAGLLGGAAAALFTAVLLLGNRAILVNASELEPETLILLLNAIALFFLAWWKRSQRFGALLGSALSLGLSAVTRPSALAVALLVGCWIVFTSPDRLRTAAWFAAGTLAPILVVVLFNLGLTGNAVIMDPGSVFYEGMNPLATGYAGVQPRIVNELERVARVPDALHLTYQLVASRAVGRPLNKDESNRYWTGKSMEFVSAYPGRAIRLLGRKLILAAKSYEAYDLATMVRKDWELQRQLWIPFGMVLALAMLGAWMRRDLAPPFLLFAAGAALPLVIFYVTARQRNGLLAPLVVLAGLGCAAMLRALRGAPPLQTVVVLGGLIAATLLFHSDGWLQREDRHAWISSFASQQRLAEARRADPQRATALRAQAATWLTTYTVAVPPALVASEAARAMQSAAAPQRLFDLAVILGRTGQWGRSAEVLERLDAAGYRPARDTRVPSSVAYHRAIAQLGLGNRSAAATLVARAREEAPGDPDILALDSLLNEPESVALLAKLHDPFTRDLALARAHAQLGQISEARALVDRMERQLPEWPAPKELARFLGKS